VTGPSDRFRAAASGPRGRKRQREDSGGGKPAVIAAAEPADGRSQSGAKSSGAVKVRRSGRGRAKRSQLPAYGALDLGTNNCRLLVARPSRRGFFVIDAFSRIIRLGEGVTRSGRFSQEAMGRTIEALMVCAEKMKQRRVKRSRVIATEACRIAENSAEFIARVREEAGLELEVVSQETEAQLAVSGCASLLDPNSDWALVFDIGGGSSELIWLDLRDVKPGGRGAGCSRVDIQSRIADWISLRLGVVTLAEKHGGHVVTNDTYEAMVEDVIGELATFKAQNKLHSEVENNRVHLMGTSGTVTTIAGIHLALTAYDRSRVDGCWLQTCEVRDVSSRLIAMSYEERVAQPCIGPERADLVLAGCAILEAVLRTWPCMRLRVADRGLREGMLANLMEQDGYPEWRRKSRRGTTG